MFLQIVYSIIITFVCLFFMWIYFNIREKNLKKLTGNKLDEFRKIYNEEFGRRKEKEKYEILKLKEIVEDIKDEHDKVVIEETNQNKKFTFDEVKQIVRKIEEELRKDSDKDIKKAKSEINLNDENLKEQIIELVMNVSKKIINTNISYNKHKSLVLECLLEIEEN